MKIHKFAVSPRAKMSTSHINIEDLDENRKKMKEILQQQQYLKSTNRRDKFDSITANINLATYNISLSVMLQVSVIGHGNW